MNALPRAGGLPCARPVHEPGHAVAAAAGQIDLALREAEAPVHRLGETVAVMVEGLGTLREALAGMDSPHAADPAEIAAGLQRQLAAAMEHAQCFDRLFQHLSHVRDFMTGVAGQLDATLPLVAGDGGWDTLCASFRTRLLTAEQRALLDRMLPPPAHVCTDEADARGSIELF